MYKLSDTVIKVRHVPYVLTLYNGFNFSKVKYDWSLSQIVFQYCLNTCHTFMTSQNMSLNGNTMGVTSGARSANPSGAPECILSFSVVRVARSLIFSVVFCWSLFVLVPLAIVLSVRRLFTAFECPFGICKQTYLKTNNYGRRVWVFVFFFISISVYVSVKISAIAFKSVWSPPFLPSMNTYKKGCVTP